MRRFGELFKAWKILRGDKVGRAGAAGGLRRRLAVASSHRPAQVKIVAGKDKGQVGTIARVLRDQNRVVVEGFNLVRAWRGGPAAAAPSPPFRTPGWLR